MIIDCAICVMDGTTACRDCVVTALLEGTAGPVHLAEDEERALGHLADAGLVAPLRLVPRVSEDRAAG